LIINRFTRGGLHVHLENNILFPKAIELERVTGTRD
jgi:iron-sulfur cluster repair protein YtfE (RIC family)